MQRGTQRHSISKTKHKRCTKWRDKPVFWFVLAAAAMFTTQQLFDPLIWNSGLVGGYVTAYGCAGWGAFLAYREVYYG